RAWPTGGAGSRAPARASRGARPPRPRCARPGRRSPTSSTAPPGCRRPTVGRADTSAARRPGTRWGPVPPGCRPAAPPRSVDVEHELGADLELGTAVDLPQRRDHLAGVAVGRDLGGDPPQRVARADDVALPLP